MPVGPKKEDPLDHATQNAAPVLSQPSSVATDMPNRFMTVPHGVNDCPPGLENLATVNQLLVREEVGFVERVMTGAERQNKYVVNNCVGQTIYQASAESSSVRCWNSLRPFDIKVTGNLGQEVIRLHKPMGTFYGCVCPCGSQKLTVYSASGTEIGSVEETSGFKMKTVLRVKNYIGETILKIEGPFWNSSLSAFTIYSRDGESDIGKISKQWEMQWDPREVFMNVNYFGISFPVDLDVRIKAVLLGAGFFIDFVYFRSE